MMSHNSRTKRLAAPLCVALFALTAALGAQTSPGQGQSVPQVASPLAADACGKLSGLKIDATEIVSATSHEAEKPVDGVRTPGFGGTPGAGAQIAGLPSFCRVVGRIHPEAGSDIGFEVWLPQGGWNGRLHGIGVGGFAGLIDYRALSLALKGGQVGVATDTGHRSSPRESAWAKNNPSAIRDYGWRAVHLSTVAAKQLTKAFYGHGPAHSYFVGCSGGGRQGLVEAGRFPEDYDGIVSGAPAASLSDIAMSFTNVMQAQMPAGAAIRANQTRLIQDEVLTQCDAADGQADGLVADPRQCKFDAEKLACGKSKSPQCFSPAQVAALKRIYRGPRDSKGRPVAPTYLPSGSEVGFPRPFNWEGYLLAGEGGIGAGKELAQGFIVDFAPKPYSTPETFNFDKDPATLRKVLGVDVDASPDLSRFFARGGKLIMWHGWADAAIPPENSLQFYSAMLEKSGGPASQSSRLYMVPGVQHCTGGLGPDSFGQLNAPQAGDTKANSMVAAVQHWVEKGEAPDAIVGRRDSSGLLGAPVKSPERERLLCRWPYKAVLKRGADPDKAASYSCTAVKG